MMTFTRSTRRGRLAAVLALGLAALATQARADNVGVSFTYQGSITDNGSAPTGPYDFLFSIYSAPTGGTLAGAMGVEDVPVVSGVFSVELDFGSAFELSEARWLEVQARQGGSTGAYTTFPRQKLNPTPYAIGLNLPHYQQFSSMSPLLQTLNTGIGSGAVFTGGTGATLGYGVIGATNSTASQAAGVRGIANGTSGNTIGVEGVATASPTGTGIVGKGTATGAYIEATATGSTGLYALGKSRAINAQNTASGIAIYATGQGPTQAEATIYGVNSGTGPAMYLTGQGQNAVNATLRVENTAPTGGLAQYAHNTSTFATAHFQNDGAGQVLWLQRQNAGNFVVAYSGSEYKFWIDNDGVTHTKVLEILGGADLSEQFDVGGEVEPGMVVAIDERHEGRLTVSRDPYDRRVAGIVSGAGGVRPGMLMGQKGTIASGDHPVALTGRVYCRATAANGPIRPGDLLTTSSLPGHAMRVDDPARAQGAILGKAMGALESGEGLVLVLVSLQ